MKYLIALLALAGIVVSGMALRVHYMDPNAAPPCAVTERFDCGTVNHSRFAVFPPRGFDEDPNSKGHIPVATLGLVAYGAMLVFALMGHIRLVFELAEVGFFFAAFLSYLEAFVLEKWCIYCLWSQGIVTVILLVSGVMVFLRWRERKVLSAGS